MNMKYRKYTVNVTDIEFTLNHINENREKIITVLIINKYGGLLIITLGQNDD